MGPKGALEHAIIAKTWIKHGVRYSAQTELTQEEQPSEIDNLQETITSAKLIKGGFYPIDRTAPKYHLTVCARGGRCYELTVAGNLIMHEDNSIQESRDGLAGFLDQLLSGVDVDKERVPDLVARLASAR